jgi:hypothetical protein
MVRVDRRKSPTRRSRSIELRLTKVETQIRWMIGGGTIILAHTLGVPTELVFKTAADHLFSLVLLAKGVL